MDIISVQRFIRVSPKKMRGVADIAKKLTPSDAISKLPFLRKRGSDVLIKVIKSALASAKQKGLSDDLLIFKEIQIGDGPRLKRGRAASRGRWHPYKRRMSNIRVVLTTRESKIVNGSASSPSRVVSRDHKSEMKVEKDGIKPVESDLTKKETGKPAVKSVKSVGKVLKSVVSRKGGKTQKRSV